MIISHRWKFIFIKTRKTAGSSIEAALASILGPDDIATGSVRDGTPRLNCPDRVTGHWGWRRIVGLASEDAFRHYRRFCVERNPYDKTVSDWLYHRDQLRDTALPLADYIERNGPSDWERYTQSGKPIARVLRFENIAKEFSAQCKTIGLPRIDLERYQLKRNPDRMPAAYYHDEMSRAAVARIFHNELRHFGYQP
jgi:hypothetical protein